MTRDRIGGGSQLADSPADPLPAALPDGTAGRPDRPHGGAAGGGRRAEPGRRQPRDALLAALGGLQFRRLLQPAATADPAVAQYLAELPATWPLTVPASNHPLLAMLGGGATDGAALYAALRSALGRELPALPGTLRSQPDPSRPSSPPHAPTWPYYEALTGARARQRHAWVPPGLSTSSGWEDGPPMARRSR